MNHIQNIEKLAKFNHIGTSLELNNNGDLAFLSLNLGRSPVEECILPTLTLNEKKYLGLHRLIQTPPLLHVHVGKDVCSSEFFCSSIELEFDQFHEFRERSSDIKKKSVDITWRIVSKQDFTWTQGQGVFVIINISSDSVSKVVWLLRLNCSDPDNLFLDLVNFGLGVHRLYTLPGFICPQNFQNSVEGSIPFIVGITSPKVNYEKGYGSEYERVSTINRVFVVGQEYKLFIAKKRYSIHKATWKIEDDLTVSIVQMPSDFAYPVDVEVSAAYTLDLQNGWSVSWETQTGNNHFQKNVPIESVNGSPLEIIGKLVKSHRYSNVRLNGTSPDSLKKFEFITEIPNRLLLPFQAQLVSFLEVNPGKWAMASDSLPMDRYSIDASVKIDPKILLSQDAETTPSVLFETPSEQKHATLDVNNLQHLEWLQNLFKERWVVYPKCGHDDSEIVVFEDVAHIFVRVDIHPQFLYLSDYEEVQDLHVRMGSQHHYSNNTPFSLEQLKEKGSIFTDIFQRVMCRISILQHREQSARIAIIHITSFAQEWLNICFLNDVRPFAACLPRHGFDGDKESGDFFTNWFASEFSKGTKYIISNISFVQESNQDSPWQQWSIFGGYVRGHGGQHRVSRRLYVNDRT